ncbi:GTP-binding protein [Aliamphritea spongicola]|nr:GTP-binding protein [Aliamphritea spongicola]
MAADTPGHEQYTRNMATGASTSEVAVILVDARKGMMTQTRRHSFIVALMGIRHVILAVNKMDLVGYDQASFDHIVTEYQEFAHEVGITSIDYIPSQPWPVKTFFSLPGRCPGIPARHWLKCWKILSWVNSASVTIRAKRASVCRFSGSTAQTQVSVASAVPWLPAVLGWAVRSVPVCPAGLRR